MTCGPAAVQRRTRSYVTPGSSCVGLPAAAGVRINARRTTARSLRDIRPRSRVAETAVFLLLAGLFFTTGGTAATPHHNRPVPILMYHVIADAPAGAAFPELFVTPADFAGQMHRLARRAQPEGRRTQVALHAAAVARAPDARRRLGARRAHDHASRSNARRRRAALARSRRLARRAAAHLPRTGRFLLLPVGTLRRARDRRGP